MVLKKQEKNVVNDNISPEEVKIYKTVLGL